MKLPQHINFLSTHDMLETTIIKEHDINHNSLIKNQKVDGRHLAEPFGQRLVEEFTHKKRRMPITSNEY